jgi:hypothetical protein
MADATPPAPTPPPGSHDRRALLQAYQDVVRTEHDKRTTQPVPVKPESRAPFWVTMGLLIAGLTSILVLQPGWLFPKVPEESREIREASLRVMMFVEIEQIEQFRSANSRLPATLLEAGADTAGMNYNAGGDSYSLSGVNKGITLTYTSGQTPSDFLGNSYQLLAQRRHR